MKELSPARRVATHGILLALALVLSFLEGLIPPIPGLPPNSKLGLSNTVIMYALFFLGNSSAFILAFLKSLFVFLVRGTTSGFLSLCGGLASIIVIATLYKVFPSASYLILSIAGAVSHNLGQLLGSLLFFQEAVVLLYLPILTIVGILMGTLTSILLKAVIPALNAVTSATKSQKH